MKTAILLSVALFGALALQIPAAAEDAPKLLWTIDQEQEFVVMGLRLDYEYKADSTLKLSCEVTSTTEHGFACSITREDDTAATAGSGGWDNLNGRTLDVAWGALADWIKGSTVGSKKLKVDKEQVETTTYTTTRAAGDKKNVSVLYLAKEFPAVIVKRETWVENAKGKASDKTTLSLKSIYSIKDKVKELTGKLPFDDEACRKFFVKGLKLNYHLIDGQKLAPGGEVDDSQAMAYTVEVIEVAKASHVQNVPTRWENGAPAEYTKESVVWQEVLDSYSDFLGSGEVSNGTVTVGDATLACVNVTGARRAYGDFTEEITLSFSKEYPSVLVYKQVVCTNTVSGAKSVSRLGLKSITRP
ncbi:MAG: hypothetical protein IT462_01020 [Planctomycetes bacterium]|nr:hypothetical protein [Planctomycetota bacterium]